MSFIEANITIDLPDGQDPTAIIEEIRSIISSFNDKNTNINVIEVDDPVSTNPIYFTK
jgi:hypothetical protein